MVKTRVMQRKTRFRKYRAAFMSLAQVTAINGVQLAALAHCITLAPLGCKCTEEGYLLLMVSIGNMIRVLA